MGMTMTQKILAKHAGMDEVKKGQLIEANLDLVLGNDITTPVAIAEFNKLGIDEVKIEINDGEVDITLVDGIDLILLKESNILRVRSSYRGIISDEKKIIERNR